MVLRPWAERDKPFLWWHATLPYMHELSHVKLVTFPYRYAGNAEVFDAFNLPANLFLEGQAYRLDCQVERTGDQAGLALSFQQFQTPLGKLHLGGDFIHRIVLDSGASPDGITAVFDAPAADVEVPVGIYARQLVLLQRAAGTNVAVGLGTNRLAGNGNQRGPAGRGRAVAKHGGDWTRLRRQRLAAIPARKCREHWLPPGRSQ